MAMVKLKLNKSSRRRAAEKRTIISLYQLDPSFYNKIISRKSSVGNAESHLTHLSPSAAAVANVPFVWEVHPGTPKLGLAGEEVSVAKSSTATLPPSIRIPKLTNLTGFAQFNGRQRRRRSLVTGKKAVEKLGSEISGKVKEVFWKGVDGAHKKLKGVSGKKIVRQLKARVAPVVDRRGGGSPPEGGIGGGGVSRDVKLFSVGVSPAIMSVFRRGSSGVAVSPAIDGPTRFAWRSVLGKKLVAKLKFVKGGKAT
ncbi:hypothetical protein LINGRAPRIM_LOCUS1345 [Linum grandiflorum]